MYDWPSLQYDDAAPKTKPFAGTTRLPRIMSANAALASARLRGFTKVICSHGSSSFPINNLQISIQETNLFLRNSSEHISRRLHHLYRIKKKLDSDWQIRRIGPPVINEPTPEVSQAPRIPSPTQREAGHTVRGALLARDAYQ